MKTNGKKSSSKSRQFDSLRRRDVLTTSGASLAGLSVIPRIGSAGQPSRDEIIQKGLRIRDKTGSTDHFVKYLRNHGFTVIRTTSTVSASKSSDSGVSPEYLDEADLTMELSIFYQCYTCDYDCVVDLSWDWSGQDFDDWGEPPRDITGFYWEDSDWNLATADYYRSDRVYFDGFSGTHTSFEFNDSKGDDGDLYYCASELSPIGDVSQSEREVGGEYVHTYDSVQIESVSGSFPKGIRVKLSNDNKKWDHNDTVDQSEA